MNKLYIILYVFILLVIPIYATPYFQYKFDKDITIICPDCDYYIHCDSNSMSPTFSCNDTLITIKPSTKGDIQVGDIIWFSSNEYEDFEYIVHRVVKIDYKGCYITKGDNNDYEDEFTPCFYDIKFKVRGILYE